MRRPDDLPAEHRNHLNDLLAACPHLTTLAQRVREFASLPTNRHGQDLDVRMTTVDSEDLSALHAFVHGLRMDLPAVVAGLTLPYSNGPIEGANTKVKTPQTADVRPSRIPLLRRRILLHRSTTATTVSVPEPFGLQSSGAPGPRLGRRFGEMTVLAPASQY
jgi:transposase